MTEGQKCYMCDSVATTKEHVPPRCIFPEAKDVGQSFNENLITVPSCEEHNLSKSKDDEFLMACLPGIVGNNVYGYLQMKTKVNRALNRKHKGFIERIIKDAEQIDFKTETGHFFPILAGSPDIMRLKKCIDHVVYGLYYHEFGKRLRGEIQMLFGFINYADKNTNGIKDLVKEQFKIEWQKLEMKGSNPKIFYYQLIPRDNFGLIGLKMTFFEGADIFISIKDEDSKEPFDLGMKLIQGGSKTTVKLGDKEFKFN
jgi:hypothetical protein